MALAVSIVTAGALAALVFLERYFR